VSLIQLHEWLTASVGVGWGWLEVWVIHWLGLDDEDLGLSDGVHLDWSWNTVGWVSLTVWVATTAAAVASSSADTAAKCKECQCSKRGKTKDTSFNPKSFVATLLLFLTVAGTTIWVMSVLSVITVHHSSHIWFGSSDSGCCGGWWGWWDCVWCWVVEVGWITFDWLERLRHRDDSDGHWLFIVVTDGLGANCNSWSVWFSGCGGEGGGSNSDNWSVGGDWLRSFHWHWDWDGHRHWDGD
jgi:hypothetical protein